MSAIEEISAGISGSAKIDDGTKAVLLDFLTAASPVLSSLEAGAVQELMGWISGGGDGGGVVPPVVDQLTAPQVAALLTVTEEEMGTLLDDRLKQVAAARAAVGSLGDAALSVLARVLISAL